MFIAKNDHAAERVCTVNNMNTVWHNRYGHLNFKSLQDLSDNPAKIAAYPEAGL